MEFAIVFIIFGTLALCRADDNDDFPIFWNIPADPCTKYGYNYTSLDWKFLKNSNNRFVGERITTMYNIGSFPRIDVDKAGYITRMRNNGVPQAGNMTKHMLAFMNALDLQIPDLDNEGLAIIDMEDWYPRWKLNSGTKDIYRLYSRELIRENKPTLKSWEVEYQAIDSFHSGCKKFLIFTIRAAKYFRPNAVWGYYEFPYCDNYALTSPDKMDCSRDVKIENEKYLWLYDEVDALYPFIYLYPQYPEELRAKHIIGRLEETYRVLRLSNLTREVYPYASPMLIDSNTFLSYDDLMSSLLIPKVCGTDGVIVWGSSSWFNTREECSAFDEYLTSTLGPVVNDVASISIEDARQWLAGRGERDDICNY